MINEQEIEFLDQHRTPYAELLNTALRHNQVETIYSTLLKIEEKEGHLRNYNFYFPLDSLPAELFCQFLEFLRLNAPQLLVEFNFSKKSDI